MFEQTTPPATSSDPGDEHHRIEAPQSVSIEVAQQKLSSAQMAALRALCSGQTQAQAAEASGVSRRSIYTWLKTDPNFRALYHAWREESIEIGRARLLTMIDLAMNAVLKSLEKGDAHAALALLRGLGVLAAAPTALTDPVALAREMELDRRGQRVELAGRSRLIAEGEARFLSSLTNAAKMEELREALIRRGELNPDGTTPKPANDPGASGGAAPRPTQAPGQGANAATSRNVDPPRPAHPGQPAPQGRG